MSWAINKLSYICIKYSTDNLKMNKFIKDVVSSLLTPRTVEVLVPLASVRNYHIWAKTHGLVWEDFVAFYFSFPFFFFSFFLRVGN